jgi:hypothetical protein
MKPQLKKNLSFIVGLVGLWYLTPLSTILQLYREIKVEIVLVILILKISWGYHSSNHIWIGFMIHKFIYTCEFDYTNGMVYTLIIQLYVIKFVSDLWRSMVFEHYKIIETLLKV